MLTCCAGLGIKSLATAITCRGPALPTVPCVFSYNSPHIVDLFPNLPSMKHEHIYFVLQLQTCFLIGGDRNQMVARRIVAMVTDPTEMGGGGGYTFHNILLIHAKY